MDKPAEPTELRILLLEDVPTDAELVENALREAGLSFTTKRVDTRETFIRALEEFKPDIVLADYHLPAFDGGSALKIVQQQYPSVPVVIVTGAVGDEKAVDLLKQGAMDYVLKDRLSRLGPAVQRALSEEQGIRARKAAEEALCESEKKFRIIFEGALDGILLADVKTKQFITGNPAICRMLGYSSEELMRLGISDIHLQQDLPNTIEMFEKLSRGEIQLAADIPVKRKDGSVFYADIKGHIVNFGGKNCLVGIFRDITERKQTEARIQKLTRLYALLSQTNETIVRTTSREELFSNICKAAVIHGKFVLAWVGLVDEATRRVKPVCHYGAEEDYLTDIVISIDDVPEGRGPTGTSIRENYVSYVNNYATDERTLPWREAALKCGFCGAAGLPLRFKGKAIGALTLYTNEPDFFDTDQLNLLEEMATDIGYALDNFAREAERTHAEEELRASEQKFMRLFVHVPIPIAVVNGDGVMIHFNKRFTEILGYTIDDIPTLQEWFQRAYPDASYRRWVLDTWNAAVAKAVKEGMDIESIEYRVACKNGAERIMLIGGITLEDNLLATLIDITERKQAEEKFQRFFELIPDLVCMASADGRLLEINPMWQKTLGYTKQEILSKPFIDLVHPDDIAATLKEVGRQLAGKPTTQFINRYRCKDGSYRWLEWETTPAVDGKLLFATARDITGRKQAESQLTEQFNELRRWHDATLGREMRTLELKHEVNELLVHAGQPPRYPSAEQDDGRHPDV